MSELALYRNKTIGFREESAPGIMETPITLAGYGLECAEISAQATAETIEKNVFRGSISSSPSRIGKAAGSVSLAGELKNSGEANVIPKIDSILRAARMARRDVLRYKISGADGIESLEIGKSVLVGGTGGARGLLLSASQTSICAAGGSFSEGEEISCGAFSATIDAADGQEGFLYSPSSSPESARTFTVDVGDGGLLKRFYGMAGTLSIELSADSYPKWNSSMSGGADRATYGTPAPPLPAGARYESHQPPVVIAAELSLGGFSTLLASSVKLDLGNSVAVIPDINSPNWIKFAMVTARAGTGSVGIAADIEKSAVLYQKLFAGETAALRFRIGDGAGNRIDIVCPAVQYAGISEGDSDSLLSQEISLKVTGEDDELLMWFR